MDPSTKYNVPALERAHRIISLIADHPSRWKLIDLSRKLDINKSSMYSLLQTMERLGWLNKDESDHYELGSFFGRTGALYFSQFDLVSLFHREGAIVRDRIQETLQLGRLDGGDVFYLAKVEAPSSVKIRSEPGMTWSAYATGLGKAMLAELSDSEIALLYPQEKLPSFTPNTIATPVELIEQLANVRESGIAFDEQEAVPGFSCIAAPIRGADGRVIAAVSCSIPQSNWAHKKEQVIAEITSLAKLLSHESILLDRGRS